MKHFKLFALALLFAFGGSVYSQWTFCAGSSQMLGLGNNPCIWTVNTSTCWVGGGATGSPRVFRTTNSGNNFSNVSGNLTGGQIYAICALSDQVCFVGDGGPNALLWRTTNGGTNWTLMLSTGGSVGFFNGIARGHNNPNFLFAESDAPTGSGPHYIAMSTNGGMNWTSSTAPVPCGAIGAAGAVYCVDNMFFGFGMSLTASYGYTTNGGTTWNCQSFSVAGTFSSGVAWNTNKMNGVFATNQSNSNVSIVTGGPGSSMQTVSTGTGNSTLTVCRFVPNTNICFIGGTFPAANGSIRMSTNNGASGSWVTMTTAGLTSWFDLGFTIDGGNIIGYAISTAGAVRLQTPVGINPINNEIPSKFVLEQNYPNPFNPSTVVKYSIPKSGYVSLNVFNSVGQEVKTIVSEQQAAGNYQFIIDLDGFSSGVYFYTLTADGFKETKKMLLVK
ncbi:MAG: T9SS type A sorting domain-containing protein [Chlorobi bacterium]|nr:T9SS type A sorting domain-containing protein [Chlorobiota bacterium]MCI0715275.1 T9SS type A sorting domain-containing protein [Chlorobiota bacterium]